AVATTRFVGGVVGTRRLDESFGEHSFTAELRRYGSVIIATSVDDAGFDILLEKGGLKSQDSAAYATYCDTVKKAEQRIQAEEKEKLEKSLAEIKATSPRLRDQVSRYLALKICDLYPTFDPEDLLPPKAPQDHEGSSQAADDLGNSSSNITSFTPTHADINFSAHFYHVRATYTSAKQAVKQAVAAANFNSINYPNFSRLKQRFLIVKGMLEKHRELSEERRTELANAVSLNGELPSAFKETRTSFAKLRPGPYVKALGCKFNIFKEGDEETLKAYSEVNAPSDTDFLKSLSGTVMKGSILAASVDELQNLALQGLRQNLESSAKALADNMISAQKREVDGAAKSSAKTRFASAEQEAKLVLRQAIANRLCGEGKQ
ncbi:hypothetical protein FRC00_012767, partial [Tulasnella sp. 408]